MDQYDVRLRKCTHEMGHTSSAIPFSRHSCINLGCFTIEKLPRIHHELNAHRNNSLTRDQCASSPGARHRTNYCQLSLHRKAFPLRGEGAADPTQDL